MKNFKTTITALLILLSCERISAQLTVNAGNDTTICYSNSVTLGGNPTAAGGTPPYNYVWSFGLLGANPVVSPTVTTIYSITVTDNLGATAVDAITVNVSDPGIRIDSVRNPTTCGGSDGQILAYGLCDFCVPSTITYLRNGIQQGPFGLGWDGAYTSVVAGNAGTYTNLVINHGPTGCILTFPGPYILSDPGPMVASITQTNVSCNGGNNGSLCVNVTGAPGPYLYSWLPTGQSTQCINNLTAGNYSVTVTAANICTAVATANITQPAPLQTTISPISATCGQCDGSISVVTTGGVPVYTYWLQDTIGIVCQAINCGLLCANGQYLMIVRDANSCWDSTFFIMPSTCPSPIANAGPDINICIGDTSFFAIGGSPTASGGTGPYTYIWAPAAALSCTTCPNPLTGGLGSTTTFMVIITDSIGASDTDFVTVFVNPSMTINSLAQTNISCFGGNNGTIGVVASGGCPPYNYQWSDGAFWGLTRDSLAAGNYALTITNGCGCSASASATITQPSQLTAQITTEPGHELPDTLLAVVTGGVGSYTYSWNQGSTTSNIIGHCAITYEVTVADMNGCFTEDSIILLDSCVADCVWPGDADDNGIADNNDLLPIGLAYGTGGPYGCAPSIVWEPKYHITWADTLANGTNYKHIDCDGNGAILADDTLAILQNFGQTHAKTDETGGWRMTDPTLFVELTPDTTHAGDTMYAYITLGDSNVIASNVYGLAFTLNYDANVVDSTKTTITFGPSWLGNATDKISIAKNFHPTGQLKCALTRIDHTNRSGFGQIGEAHFIITTDNINGKDLAYFTNHVWLSDIRMIDNLGNIIPVNAGRDSSLVEFEPTGIHQIRNPQSAIRIAPNPANDEVQITVTDELVGGEMKLLDAQGRILTSKTISTLNFELRTLNFSQGIYFIQVITANGILTKRLIIAR